MVPRLERALGVSTLVARPQHVIHGNLQLHAEQGEVIQRVDEILAEAFLIADGKSWKNGTTAHTCALVAFIRQMAADHEAAVQAILRDSKGQ